MRLRSLRLRLVLGAGGWIAVALVLAGVAIGYLFTASVESGARADLSAIASRLVALIDPDKGNGLPVLTGTLPDARYDTPFSGVYWQIADLADRRTLRSRSLWDHVLSIDAGDGTAHFVTAAGPVGQSLLARSLVVRMSAGAGERRYQVVVAQDRSILDEAIRRFGRELAVALLILGVALGFAAALQVQLGLSPLRKLRDEVETIRKGGAVSVGPDYPSEVLPLIGEVNELLASQQKSMEFARARAADLAHGLKTPLAVLGTLEHELAERGDRRSATLIAELTGEMRERIDYQMRLARLRHRTRRHAFNAPLSRIVARTVAVLKRTQKGERLDWRIEVEDDLDVDIDANDLVELVGVILENAAQWAGSLVCVRAKADRRMIELRIGDDGPGIDPNELGTIGERGHRLDETSPGSGLGLAIAREIAALNEGSIGFERSPQHGLTVSIRLPAANERAKDRSDYSSN